MGDDRAAQRLEALRLLYEFKCSPFNEKNHWRNKLNASLDALRRGSNISREETLIFLQKNYYPEYRKRRRKSEGL